MAQFQSGYENITYDNVAASVTGVAAATAAVTANGVRGTIAMGTATSWGNGTGRGFTLNNSSIQADSLINACVIGRADDTNSVSPIPSHRIIWGIAAGTCKIGIVNATGGTIGTSDIVYVGFEVVN